MPPASAPLVVCLACRAGDQSRRIQEVLALATDLGGVAEVHDVSGRTTALMVTVPENAADRLIAAMTLNGATTGGGAAGAGVIVLITAEPHLQE